jgi:hypothetical protein
MTPSYELKTGEKAQVYSAKPGGFFNKGKNA